MESDLVSRERARAESFRLLAECYYPPNRELVEKLNELAQQLDPISSGAASLVKGMKEELVGIDDLEPLTVDYAKLFLGPYKVLAPPYGSVYLDGDRKVMGDSTLDVKNWYREEGVDISSDFQDPPDHVAAELEFMYFLVLKEVEAIGNSDTETTLNFVGKQRAFLREHLGAWVFDFADSIEEKAETGFYKNLAKATRAFVSQDLDYLSELPDLGADGGLGVSVGNS